MREQNALPGLVGFTIRLTAKDAIDNGGAGRAAKGATLVSRAKCGFLCARSPHGRAYVRAHLVPKKRYQRFSYGQLVLLQKSTNFDRGLSILSIYASYLYNQKRGQFSIDKEKIYDILWQTNESEWVRLFALF